jgi:hypothetical protein
MTASSISESPLEETPAGEQEVIALLVNDLDATEIEETP